MRTGESKIQVDEGRETDVASQVRHGSAWLSRRAHGLGCSEGGREEPPTTDQEHPTLLTSQAHHTLMLSFCTCPAMIAAQFIAEVTNRG